MKVCLISEHDCMSLSSQQEVNFVSKFGVVFITEALSVANRYLFHQSMNKRYSPYLPPLSVHHSGNDSVDKLEGEIDVGLLQGDQTHHANIDVGRGHEGRPVEGVLRGNSHMMFGKVAQRSEWSTGHCRTFLFEIRCCVMMTGFVLNTA